MSNEKAVQHQGLSVIEPLREMERVITPMRERVGSYARLIQELFGESGKALTVFGAVLIDGFDVDRDTVRSVLVVERIELPLLRRLADRGAKLGKTGVAAPLIMTPDHIRTSLDTFPLELMEIQQRHATLFGQDFFSELSFDNAHVRLQCERELKRTLIALRQGLLACAGRKRLIPMMEKDAAEDLARTLRGLLRLKGHKDFKEAADIVTDIESITSQKLPGLRTALHLLTAPGWADFDLLYREVEALGEIVNAW